MTLIDARNCTPRPHPEERALARVSKDGRLEGRRLWPSFETQRRALLLRMRVNSTIDKIGLPDMIMRSE
jgi:hypothetical protein